MRTFLSPPRTLHAFHTFIFHGEKVSLLQSEGEKFREVEKKNPRQKMFPFDVFVQHGRQSIEISNLEMVEGEE
jgi:hypothetical protein